MILTLIFGLQNKIRVRYNISLTYKVRDRYKIVLRLLALLISIFMMS